MKKMGSNAKKILGVSAGVTALVLLALIGIWVLKGSKSAQITAVFPLVPNTDAWVFVHSPPTALSEAVLYKMLEEIFATKIDRASMKNLLEDVRDIAVFVPLGEWSQSGPMGALKLPPSKVKSIINKDNQSLGEFRTSFDAERGVLTLKTTEGLPLATLWSPGGDILCFAVNEADAELMKKTYAGDIPPLVGKWDVEPSWDAHAAISDGGQLSGYMAEEEAKSGQNGQKSLTFQAAWNASDATDKEAKWQVFGAQGVWKDLDAADWNKENFSIASPTMLAAGINAPRGGRILELGAFAWLGNWLEGLNIDKKSINALLSGPMVFSLGGKTTLFWFDLPGFLASFHGKGDAASDVVNGMWANLFSGTASSPLEGFSEGGFTDFPFAFLGAIKGEEALLGSITPRSVKAHDDRDKKEAPFFGEDVKACAWLYVDLPRMGDAINDMSKLNRILKPDNDDINVSEDPIASDSMRRFLTSMQPFLLIFEKPDRGTLQWGEN